MKGAERRASTELPCALCCLQLTAGQQGCAAQPHLAYQVISMHAHPAATNSDAERKGMSRCFASPVHTRHTVPPTAAGRGQCMHGAAGPVVAMLGALPGKKPAISGLSPCVPCTPFCALPRCKVSQCDPAFNTRPGDLLSQRWGG